MLFPAKITPCLVYIVPAQTSQSSPTYASVVAGAALLILQSKAALSRRADMDIWIGDLIPGTHMLTSPYLELALSSSPYTSLNSTSLISFCPTLLGRAGDGRA